MIFNFMTNSLSNWDPFVQMRSAINSIDNFLPQSLSSLDNDYEIFEEGNNLFVKLNVPGFKKEDVNVEFEDDVLTISAETKVEEEKKEGKTYYKQMSKKSFSRSFRLPVKVSDKVEAKMENGVLEVKFEKSEVKPKGKVEVK